MFHARYIEPHDAVHEWPQLWTLLRERRKRTRSKIILYSEQREGSRVERVDVIGVQLPEFGREEHDVVSGECCQE